MKPARECDNVRRDLLFFVETEQDIDAEPLLSEERRSSIADHLRSCEECAAEAAAIREAMAVADQVEELEPSTGFAPRVKARLKERTRSRIVSSRLVPVGFAVATLLLFVVLAGLPRQEPGRIQESDSSMLLAQALDTQVENDSRKASQLVAAMTNGGGGSLSLEGEAYVKRAMDYAESIELCKQAVLMNPDNVHVKRCLARLMAGEVEALKSVYVTRPI